MKFFGNDEDGFTIVDFFSIIIVMSVILLIFTSLIYPDKSSIIQFLLDYLKLPLIIVLTYHFGKSILWLNKIPFLNNFLSKTKNKNKDIK